MTYEIKQIKCLTTENLTYGAFLGQRPVATADSYHELVKKLKSRNDGVTIPQAPCD